MAFTRSGKLTLIFGLLSFEGLLKAPKKGMLREHLNEPLSYSFTDSTSLDL